MRRTLVRGGVIAFFVLIGTVASVTHASDRVTLTWTPIPIPCPEVGANAVARWTLSATVNPQSDGSIVLRGLEVAFASAALALGTVTISGSLTVGDVRVGLVPAWFAVISDGRAVTMYPRGVADVGDRDGILPIRLLPAESLVLRAGAVLRRAGGACPIGNLDRALEIADFREAQR